MIPKQDRQGARTPAELESKYKFRKNFKEIKESNKELSVKVERSVQTDEKGNLKSRLHVGAGMLTIDTDNFKIKENGDVEVSGTVSAITEKNSVTLDDGRVKINSSALNISDGMVFGAHIPLLEFVYNGETMTLLAFRGAEGEWSTYIKKGTFEGNTDTPDTPIQPL